MKKLLAVVCVIALVSCSKKPVLPDTSKHVDVVTVYASDIPYVINYPAIVQGVVDYQVIPRVSGAIYKKFYKEGSFVKKNQALYEIDPRPFELQLKNYQGQLTKDQAALDNLKVIYERYVDLYKYNAVAKQDVENARINYQAAVGNVETDHANINQAKLNILYCLVRSPADGYIAERIVTIGTMVTAFQTVLNNINSVNDMYLLFSMPENHRIEIENGVIDHVISVPKNYTFRIDVQLADGKKILDAGYVEFTDTRISLDNGVWNMRGYVDNNFLKNKLLSGQYVTVYIHGINYVHVYSVPQQAVLHDDNGAFVYLLKHGKATKQIVQTGKMVNLDWIITSGLHDGDTVITNGNIRIHSGSNVIADDQHKQVNAIDGHIKNNESMIRQEATEVAKNTSSAIKEAQKLEGLGITKKYNY